MRTGEPLLTVAPTMCALSGERKVAILGKGLVSKGLALSSRGA